MYVYAALCVSNEPGKPGFILSKSNDPTITKVVGILLGEAEHKEKLSKGEIGGESTSKRSSRGKR